MRRGVQPHHDNLVRAGLIRPPAGGSAAVIANNDIFGLGEDGAAHITAPASGFVGGDYTTFVLDPAVTLTGAADRPILIRATTSITINGTIDASGLISRNCTNIGLVGQQLYQSGGSGGGGGGNSTDAGADGSAPPLLVDPVEAAYIVALTLVPDGYTPGLQSALGLPGTGGPANAGGGSAGAPQSATLGTPALAAFTDLQRIRTGIVIEQYVGGTAGGLGLNGGDGGDGQPSNAGGEGGTGNLGGNGGASIYLVAPAINFGGAASLLSNGSVGLDGGAGAAGTAGGDDGGGGGGGGGSGGQGGLGGIVGVFYGTSVSGAPTTSVLGGAGAPRARPAPAAAAPTMAAMDRRALRVSRALRASCSSGRSGTSKCLDEAPAPRSSKMRSSRSPPRALASPEPPGPS